MHKVAANGAPEDLKRLLTSESGANVEQRDVYGRTPLMIASRHENDSALALLLGAGADLFAEDIFGNRALDHLKSRLQEGPEKAVRKPAKSENKPLRERPLASLAALSKHSVNAARGVPFRLPDVNAGTEEPVFRNEHTGQELTASKLIALYNHYLNYSNDDRYIAASRRFGLFGGYAFRFAYENLTEMYKSGWEYFKEAQGWHPTQGQAVAVEFGRPSSLISYFSSNAFFDPRRHDVYDFWEDARELVSRHWEANETIRLEIPGVLSANGSVLYFLETYLPAVLNAHILEYARDLAVQAPDEDEEDEWDLDDEEEGEEEDDEEEDDY